MPGKHVEGTICPEKIPAETSPATYQTSVEK